MTHWNGFCMTSSYCSCDHRTQTSFEDNINQETKLIWFPMYTVSHVDPIDSNTNNTWDWIAGTFVCTICNKQFWWWTHSYDTGLGKFGCFTPYQTGANFIELLKQIICLSMKIARLFYTCYWLKFHGIYIACDWYLAVNFLE